MTSDMSEICIDPCLQYWPVYSINPLTPTVAIWGCYMHPVPERVKPSFVIFDIRAF